MQHIFKFNVELGERVRLAREHRGISREHMAQRLGPSRQMDDIIDFETGMQSITACDLSRIAEILGIPVHYLLGDEALLDWFADKQVAEAYTLIDEIERKSARKLILDLAGNATIEP